MEVDGFMYICKYIYIYSNGKLPELESYFP